MKKILQFHLKLPHSIAIRFFMVLMFFSAFSLQAQNVILDPNFLSKLIALGVDTNFDGQISDMEAMNYRGVATPDPVDPVNGMPMYNFVLNVEGSGTFNTSENIYDLSGIEYFTNIFTINCSYNNLTTLNLSALSPNVTTVNCSDNQITSLDASNLLNCNNLNCSNNQLENLNVSGLTNLYLLDATNNPNLTCIQVADEATANYYNTNFTTWFKDATASYAANCGTNTGGPTAAALSVLSGVEICAGSSSELGVAIRGGTPPYTVVYADGASEFTVNNYISGTAIPITVAGNTEFHLVSVTDADGRLGRGIDNSARFVVVHGWDSPSFTQVAPICAGATLNPLPTTSNNGITGTWSPALNNTETTTYTFTPNTAGQCIASTTMTITVKPYVTPTFSQINPICSGTIVSLPTISNEGISGIWEPAINNLATTTYTFIPNDALNSCFELAYMTISVIPTLVPSFPANAPVFSGTNISLPTTSDNGINGFWTPAINSTTTTTYTFTPNEGQCATQVFKTIYVVENNNSCGIAALLWQKNLEGNMGGYLNSFQATNDGGYIIVGSKATANYSTDGWVEKISSAGMIEWEYSFNGSDNKLDAFYSVKESANGDFIIVGYTNYTGNVSYAEKDGWVVKLSGLGQLIWQKVYHTNDFVTLPVWSVANTIDITTDGGFIVGGYKYRYDVISAADIYAYWILKYSNNGDLLWEKVGTNIFNQYSIPYSYVPSSIKSSSDGGYIMSGDYYPLYQIPSGYNGGNSDAQIIKFSSSGNVQWQKFIGGSNTDSVSDFQATPDGGFIAAGNTRSNNGNLSGNHGNIDAWVVKLTNVGDTQWQKLLGGTEYDYARSIQLTPDGGYIVGGQTDSNDGDVTGQLHLTPSSVSSVNNYDIWALKLSNTGLLQWQKPIGGSGYDRGGFVQIASDGGYVIAGGSDSTDFDAFGNTANDAWVIKLGCSIAPVASAQSFCQGKTVADLVATGTALKWYVSPSGGTVLDLSTNLATGNYYVSQTVNGLESPRTLVAVTINPNTTPIGESIQFVSVGNSSNATIADLVVSPPNSIWYATMADALAGTNSLSSTTILTIGSTYYAVNVIETCASTPFAVTVSGTLGIDTFDAVSLNYYPNPTVDILNINYSKEISEISVLNLLGQTVLKNKPNSIEVQIDLSNLPNATYFVKVVSEGKVKIIKIIKGL